jgi:hypothetical protein
MRSKALNLSDYDTDKGPNQYLGYYDKYFTEIHDAKLAILELGVLRGGSHLMWKDYFPNARIAGVDIHLPADWVETERIHLYQGSQTDTGLLTEVARQTAHRDGFDIIIDDASHLGKWTKISFWHLFDNHLRPGGYYVIEDWATGYLEDFTDGRSFDMQSSYFDEAGMSDQVDKEAWPNHSHGMVGFVKQLIDEQAATIVHQQTSTAPRTVTSRFDFIHVYECMVVVRKRLR